jgi:hypothetical protein
VRHVEREGEPAQVMRRGLGVGRIEAADRERRCAVRCVAQELPGAVSEGPASSASCFTRAAEKVAPNWPTTFTATSMSASAQKRSSSRARAAAAAGASRCETAFTCAAKSAIARLNASISSSATGPLRLASCSPARSSRQLPRGEVATGCHCSSTMPSTCTAAACEASANSSGSSCSRETGSSARITATVSMRADISASGPPAAASSSAAASGFASARASTVSPSSAAGIFPSVGSRRSSAPSSKSASPAPPPKACSARRRARRSTHML